MCFGVFRSGLSGFEAHLLGCSLGMVVLWCLSRSHYSPRFRPDEIAFWWFGVCHLSDFSNGVSDGVLVAWLSVVSRTSLLFFRSFRVLVTSSSLSFEGVLLVTF